MRRSMTRCRREQRLAVFETNLCSRLEEGQSVIKTISKGVQIAYDTAVENAKRQCRKIVNLMFDLLAGDFAGVVGSLIRTGYLICPQSPY